MKQPHTARDKRLKELQEREKELRCLYTIEDILNSITEIEQALQRLVDVIPSGWQHPERCLAQIQYKDQSFCSSCFQMTEWRQCAPILVNGHREGEIVVCYTRDMPLEFEGPFLKEERKLLNNIADRVGGYLFYRQSKAFLDQAREQPKGQEEWQVIVNLLRKTDHELFLYITRKMLYQLCWNGIEPAQELLENFGTNQKLRRSKHVKNVEDLNKPIPKLSVDIFHMSPKIFSIASQYLKDEEILANIQRWIQESKTNFVVRALDSRESALGEMVDAVRHFHHLMLNEQELPIPTQKIVNVSVALGFFTDQLDFIHVAKNFIDIEDIYELLKRVIFSVKSRGRLGGKSAGLFLASQILKKMSAYCNDLAQIKVPKTWYITSDGILKFLLFNNLEEVMEQKYKPVEQVRMEYPHIIQIFKNSPFPPEMVKGLSVALDDFGERPLIVRSSSLLEDRLGTAFSGKYKSLFLANQGTKAERLEALIDAIAEVYASTFGPDPLEYRTERELIDFHEEMSIMIQEVVGSRVGDYFLPSYAGVAFSSNEFRWSPRIKREDGLIRLVPGLGTRAVDRVADDYSVLIAPGQPNLRVNVTIDECVRYAPKKVDVINLKTNTFETIEFDELVRGHGDEIPGIQQIVSICKDDLLASPGVLTDFSEEEALVTFEGLRTQTNFIQHIRSVLKVLEEKLRTPIDIEFASDGRDLYLLQCRSQSSLQYTEVTPIPRDIPKEKQLFSANKFVSNALLTDISHIVYVDPQAYSSLEQHSDLMNVGRAVSKLNKLLPKRQFILMGPGRWGSRGDIKLGVNVTYSDINNTAALIEVAMKKGNYVPELSFGTHFFQDLVEASIFYLPLYPGNDGIVFNEEFLTGSQNILSHILPDYAALSPAIKVLDVPTLTNGQMLTLVMNAEEDEALAYLDVPKNGTKANLKCMRGSKQPQLKPTEDFWRWRLEMATHIASQIDPAQFGVKAVYVIGSTKNATAGPASDIDLLVHFQGTALQRKELQAWLQGWSLCLDEMNYQKTGYRTGGLLDAHIITDEDIENRTSFAVKIGAITDAARQLPMMGQA